MVLEGVRACSWSCPQVARTTAPVTRERRVDGARAVHVSTVGLPVIGWLVGWFGLSPLGLSPLGLSLSALLACALALVPVRAVSRLPLPPTLFPVVCQRRASRALELATSASSTNRHIIHTALCKRNIPSPLATAIFNTIRTATTTNYTITSHQHGRIHGDRAQRRRAAAAAD